MTILGLHRLLLVVVGLGASQAWVTGCRSSGPSSRDEDAGGATASAGSASAGAVPDELIEDAAVPAPSDQGRSIQRRRDAGDVAPACEGRALSLLGAAVDPHCELPEREWKAVPRSEGAGLRQEARRDGDAIILSVVNGGAAPVTVPLRFHPGHPELAFSVLAEVDGHAVFELAPPGHDAPAESPRGSGAATTQGRGPRFGIDAAVPFVRVHSAHIRLAPGGAARARLVIDPRIVKRLDQSCGDAGALGRSGTAKAGGDAGVGVGPTGECLPARLPKGRVVLYVGQLVVATDVGSPARVEWDAP